MRPIRSLASPARLLTLLWLTAAALLTSTSAVQAQTAPPNDLCSNAQVVNPTGLFTAGTTAWAADDILGLLGCQSGSVPTATHPDVWFQFTATGTALTYSLSSINNPGSPPIEVSIFSGTCTNALLVLDSKCGLGSANGQLGGLNTGQTYLVAVSSASVQDTTAFAIQLTTSNLPILSAQDCDSAAVLASASTITVPLQLNGHGTVPNEVTDTNSCFGAQIGVNTAERQSKWYKFVAGATGKLVFNINPAVSNDDYDWAVWDITGDPNGCTTKGNAIACNWTGARGATGLSLCPNQEPGYLGGDQFDNTTTGLDGAAAPIDVVAGKVYALLVDNYSTTMAGFTLTFGGACNPAPGGTPVAQIALDAEFTTVKPSCSVVEFTKVHQLDTTQVGATFFWNFGDGSYSNRQNPTHTYNPAAGINIYTATLQVTDVLGARYTSSQQITIAPPVLVGLPPAPPSICQGDAVAFSLSGADRYSWSPSTGLNINSGPNVIATPTQTTIYTITATRDSCTSIDTVQILVSQPVALQLSAATPTICLGASTVLSATGGAVYQWTPTTGLSFTNDSTVVAQPLVTTRYFVTSTHGECSDTSSVVVTVVPAPLTLALADQRALCQGETTTLRARGAPVFVWNADPSLSSTTDSVVTVTPTQTTTYLVTGINGQCQSTDTITIVVTPTIQVTATTSRVDVCPGETATLTARGADRYEWSPATGLSSTTDSVVVTTPQAVTTYTVIGFRGSCADTATVTVQSVPPAAVTGIIGTTSGQAPLTTTFTATVPGGTSYVWNFGDGWTSTEANPTHEYEFGGDYPVTLTAVYSSANCTSPPTAIGTVSVQPVAYNIITPNNDGQNDMFSVPVTAQAIHLKVFTRWGKKVLDRENYQQNWNGDDLPAGTYYYHVEVPGGRTWKGWLEIVR